ncbi:MAG: GNAT family N-acetyltransferase [Chloroflexota bacterium]
MSTKTKNTEIAIRSAKTEDVDQMVALIDYYVEKEIMLPRRAESIRESLDDWLVATLTDETDTVIGFGSLVELTQDLVEIRSIATIDGYEGAGIGSQIVLALVELAHIRNYAQVCALTLRETFFTRLGFELVDRWSISPKVWQACIFCPKFNRCDEVAVLMNLVEQPEKVGLVTPVSKGIKQLMQRPEWGRPLRLAYQHRPMGHHVAS